MRELFRKKHELWLRMLYGAFALPKGEEFDRLLDFAAIELRHLKWLATDMVRQGFDFDWDRGQVPIVHVTSHGIYEALLESLRDVERAYGAGALYERMQSDEAYMQNALERMLQSDPIEITAFSKELRYENLDGVSLQALVQFLFEESYKEYELIVTYFYSAMHTDSVRLYSIFEDLIYESIYHLKSFSVLMAKLGILTLPRTVMKEVYKFEDLKSFLEKGIEEELAAKEECKKLATSIKDEELSRFFSYIDNQENYHIELMKEAIALLR